MTSLVAPPGVVTEEWADTVPQAQALAARLRASVPAAVRTFDPLQVGGLPEPARRWLTHAIAPGTPLAAGAEMHMRGQIRLGHWRSFTGREVIVPGQGFVWAARTHVAGIPVEGYDAYVEDEGAMRWRLGGVVPLQTGNGFDVSLSAFDRLVAESVLAPTALVEGEWLVGYGRNSAVLSQQRGSLSHWTRVTVWVEPNGQLANLSMWRWGDPAGRGTFALHRFEVAFDGEFCSGGVRVPAGIRAAWVGAGGLREEFFRAEIDAVTPLLGAA